ncbi:hypothetical protein [Streptomyces kronopolitis]
MPHGPQEAFPAGRERARWIMADPRRFPAPTSDDVPRGRAPGTTGDLTQ